MIIETVDAGNTAGYRSKFVEDKNGFVVLDDNFISWMDAFGLSDRFVA